MMPIGAKKCKFYSPDPTASQDIRIRDIIHENLKHIQEGIFINNTGDILRRVKVFNVSVGDTDYIASVLQTKASQVTTTTRKYVENLAHDHPQELWTMLQYSLQHRVAYWLKICTPAETEEMAYLVDTCISEAVEAATSIDFDQEEMAEERLRLPARIKGGGIKKQTDMRRPAFLGALSDILSCAST
jgi:hypothetical protein